jgi:alkylation response protein AidB-like acyl-CoA dehydrogenase
MDFEIQPATEAGRRYVELCEEHAADFATRADEHDRDGSFPFENLDALQASGVLSAALPVEYGGLGIESLQDLAAGLNRLARGDGSTAIAANMHIVTPWTATRIWREAQANADAELVARAEGILEVLGGLVVCVSITEAGTSAFFPLTEATPVEGGWRLNGRKIFGTLSPRADILVVQCRFAGGGDDDDGDGDDGDDDDEDWRWSFAFVPRDAEGLSINDDWDALGMRASPKARGSSCAGRSPRAARRRATGCSRSERASSTRWPSSRSTSPRRGPWSSARPPPSIATWSAASATRSISPCCGI